MRFVPGKRIYKNVFFIIRERDNVRGVSKLWESSYSIAELKPSDGPHCFSVPFLKYEKANKVVFDVEFQYDSDGGISQWDGSWTADIVRTGSKRDRAQQIVLNIENNITCDRASEVKNSYDVKGLLEKALDQPQQEFERELDRILNGKTRAFRKCDLCVAIPPVEAKVDRLKLNLGNQRLLLFAGQSVTFGRKGDISWRHPYAETISPDDPENKDYGKISRQQCIFENNGDTVRVIDGRRDEQGRVSGSSFGTYFKSMRIDGDVSLKPGDSGLISFSDSKATGHLSACAPGEMCRECTRYRRVGCDRSPSPSLVFKRNDGLPETAVMVWSCFPMEAVAPPFRGVEIFYMNGAFGWRRGFRSGWLVPGETLLTNRGPVRVERLLSPAEIAMGAES